MKGKKVLFGLFASLSLMLPLGVNAQINTGSSLVEIGPDNIGGRVTSVLVDQSDTTHHTIYAGSASGGLFVRSNDSERAPYADMWNRVPCVIDGEEISLPISSMVQGPDNMIYIATGEGSYDKANKFDKLSQLSVGIYRFNPATGEFSLIPNSKPTDIDLPFKSINKLACMTSEGVFYLFAATNRGLYRWSVPEGGDWSAAPICYEPTKHIYDVLAIEAADMVYFSTYGWFFRISDVSANSTPVDIYGSFPTASTECMFRLAVAPSNPNYVYAMRIDQYGMLNGLYLSTDHSSWTLLTSSTVYPFTSNAGYQCGAVCVDPYNAKQVYIAGSSIYSGQGFLDGQLYTWIKNSYSEMEFGSPNYMADIFSSSSFVHSGINDIVSTWQEGEGLTYYIATNGGVFVSHDDMGTFSNCNRGLNNVSVTGLAVANDGSLLVGAADNANIFIESRNAHNGGVGVASWYDAHPELNTNHLGNVIWGGSGGQVAVSRFQQVQPDVYRNIFTSSYQYGYARAMRDYNDYTQTQTWTTGTSFLTKSIGSAYPVPHMHLWETDNITTSSDTLYTIIDTLAFATRHTAMGDTLIQMTPGTRLLAGDEFTVLDRGHACYPVLHRVDRDYTVADGDTVRTKNPHRSNLFVVDRNVGSNSVMMGVYMTWMPTNFSKVWYEHTSSTTETDEERAEKMQWSRIMHFNVTSSKLTIGGMATSNDGDILYLAVNDNDNGCSYVLRISGILRNIDYSAPVSQIASLLNASSISWALDTSRVANMTFPRMISSITVDPRENTDALILTFQDISREKNIAFVRNASTSSASVTFKSLADNIPAYCALIEYTTGEVYVGTDDGVWVTSNSSFNSASTSWQRYGSFAGVPVTSIIQQTNDMPVVHAVGHTGINTESYAFARTKYPYAIYIGTYGRGVFMDSTYVTDHTNEVVDSNDYLGIAPVMAKGVGQVKLYPNPTTNKVNLEVALNSASSVVVRIFDINGRQVLVDNLGHRAEGTLNQSIDCSALARGIYMVSVTTAHGSSSSKLVIR